MKREVLIGLCVIVSGDAFCIALAIGASPREVQRALSELCEIGYVSEEEGKYCLTDAGKALTKTRFFRLQFEIEE